MRDTRLGESLWDEWVGEGYDRAEEESLVYFTHGHVSLDHEVVRRALASVCQRDGVVDSLNDGFKLIGSNSPSHVWAGPVGEEHHMTICRSDGLTDRDDVVDTINEITLVELIIL